LSDVTLERIAEREVEAMRRKLDEVSAVDELTGLANERRFLQDCEREHRRAQRAWEPYAIARLDLDLSASHASEATVRAVAEALRAPRREYDVVARLSDGSFAILLPRAGDEAARRVMKRVVRGFRDAPVGEGESARVTLSAGVAVWTPPSADAADDLLRRAATALDAARARGPSSLAVDAGAGDWKDAIADELSEG
jgi:diguanylate cyclase (GGDEF)-like protein